MSPYLDIVLAALEDLRDDYHRKANKSFFQSRFVTYGEFMQHEATVRSCLQLLQSIPKNSVPVEDYERMAG